MDPLLYELNNLEPQSLSFQEVIEQQCKYEDIHLQAISRIQDISNLTMEKLILLYTHIPYSQMDSQYFHFDEHFLQWMDDIPSFSLFLQLTICTFYSYFRSHSEELSLRSID